MTVRVDYTQLDPPITLTLEQEGRNYIVCDGDTVYLRTPGLQMCLRFMHAMEQKRDAVIDDQSVEAVCWAAAQQATYSVRVPSNVVPLRKASA